MSGETILIVEDNQALREGLREMLSLEGYHVLCAANGKEALAEMATFHPDLILSDIAMPEMDGFEFLRAVRSRPEWVTIPFLILTARGEKDDVLIGKSLGAEDYLVKPLTRQELLTAIHARLSRAQEIKLAQLHKAYEDSLTALANAIDVRDPYTRGHVERVTAYSQVLAQEMGCPEALIEQIRFGAILHDIGKIVIQDEVLLKSSPLTQDEWEKMKRHPITGAEMIKDIAYLAAAAPIIRHHHERWDGTGYPDGLKGEEIPLGARIVAVADSFDAVSIDRPYRNGLALLEAYQEILKCSGTHFDPQVVKAFQRAWEQNKIQQIYSSTITKVPSFDST
ncbi:MAG: response regulator [Anaerolineales bacterium]|nr:response regulator [Anaerolineales bacterium]MCS7248026.1 response regulator [Anaerolineales bacterium]MDW8161838.1 response regulator [Anaerolineales bacterium]MDW8447135.1 response regulator [Anaerolineales bacterium]